MSIFRKNTLKKKKFRHPSYKLKRCDKWFFIFFPPILGFPNPQLCKSSNADDRMKTSCCCELESTKMQIFKNKYTANCSEKSAVSWRIHSGCIDKIWVFFFFFGFLTWIDDTDNYVCECNHNIDPTCVDRNDSVNAFSQIFLLPSLLRVLQRIPILVFTLRTCHQLFNRHTETNDPHCSPTDRPTGWSVYRCQTHLAVWHSTSQKKISRRLSRWRDFTAVGVSGFIFFGWILN